MLLPGSLKRLLGVSQHRSTSSSFRFDIALWKPRRCLTFICAGTGPDTSLVIQDEKITHSRTSMSSQTLRKKHVHLSKWRCKRLYVLCICLQSCFFTCKVQNWMCSISVYICSWPIWEKNANFSSTYVASQLKLCPLWEEISFLPPTCGPWDRKWQLHVEGPYNIWGREQDMNPDSKFTRWIGVSIDSTNPCQLVRERESKN